MRTPRLWVAGERAETRSREARRGHGAHLGFRIDQQGLQAQQAGVFRRHRAHLEIGVVEIVVRELRMLFEKPSTRRARRSRTHAAPLRQRPSRLSEKWAHRDSGPADPANPTGARPDRNRRPWALEFPHGHVMLLQRVANLARRQAEQTRRLGLHQPACSIARMSFSRSPR